MQTFIRIHDLGLVLSAPVEVKLWPDGPSWEPDVVFIAKAHLDRISTDRIEGAPDLIVEVVSDDRVHRDRVDKFDEYETAGVEEYWIVDNRPRRQRAYFYQLTPEGKFQQIHVDGGIYHSRVLPGFKIDVPSLWETDPDPFRLLAGLLGPEQIAEALRQSLE